MTAMTVLGHLDEAPVPDRGRVHHAVRVVHRVDFAVHEDERRRARRRRVRRVGVRRGVRARRRQRSADAQGNAGPEQVAAR